MSSMYRCNPCDLIFDSQHGLDNHIRKFCKANPNRQRALDTSSIVSRPPRPVPDSVQDAQEKPRSLTSNVPAPQQQQQQQPAPVPRGGLTSAWGGDNSTTTNASGANTIAFVFDFLTGLPKQSFTVKGWNGTVRLQYQLHNGDGTPLAESSVVPNVDFDRTTGNGYVSAQRQVSLGAYRSGVKVGIQILLLTYDMQNMLYAWSALECIDRHGSVVNGCWRIPLFLPPAMLQLPITEVEAHCPRLQDQIMQNAEVYIRVAKPNMVDVIEQKVNLETAQKTYYTPSYYKPPTLMGNPSGGSNKISSAQVQIASTTTGTGSPTAMTPQTSTPSFANSVGGGDDQLVKLQELLSTTIMNQQKEIDDLKSMLTNNNTDSGGGGGKRDKKDKGGGGVESTVRLQMQVNALKDAIKTQNKQQGNSAPPAHVVIPSNSNVHQPGGGGMSITVPLIDAGRYAVRMIAAESLHTLLPNVDLTGADVNVRIRMLLCRRVSGYADWTEWGEWTIGDEGQRVLDSSGFVSWVDNGSVHEGIFKPVCDSDGFHHMKVVVELRNVHSGLGLLAWGEYDVPMPPKESPQESVVRLRRPPVEVSTDLGGEGNKRGSRNMAGGGGGASDGIVVFTVYKKGWGSPATYASHNTTSQQQPTQMKAVPTPSSTSSHHHQPQIALAAVTAFSKKQQQQPQPQQSQQQTPTNAQQQRRPSQQQQQTPRRASQMPPQPEGEPQKDESANPPPLTSEEAQNKVKTNADRDVQELTRGFYAPTPPKPSTQTPPDLWLDVELPHLPRPSLLQMLSQTEIPGPFSLVIIVDGLRNVQMNVGCTRGHMLFRPRKGQPHLFECHQAQTFNSTNMYPIFESLRLELDAEEIVSFSEGVVDIFFEAIDAKRSRTIMGSVVLENIFQERSQEIRLNYGGGEAPTTQVTKPFRVPLATVLVRVMVVPKDSIARCIQFPSASASPESSYKAGYYDTKLAAPTPGEISMFHSIGKLVKVPCTKCIPEKDLLDILAQTGPPTVLLDTTYATQYDMASGFAFNVEGISGIRPEAQVLLKVVTEISPPSHFSLTNPELRHVTFTQQHDWDSDIALPNFTDGPCTIRELPFTKHAVLLFHVFRVVVPRGKEKMKEITPVAFSAFPLFSPPGFFNNGRFMIPLYEGPMSKQLVQDLALGPYDATMKNQLEKKAFPLRLMKPACLYFSMYDMRRNPVARSVVGDGDQAEKVVTLKAPEISAWSSLIGFKPTQGPPATGTPLTPFRQTSGVASNPLRAVCGSEKPIDVRKKVNQFMVSSLLPTFNTGDES